MFRYEVLENQRWHWHYGNVRGKERPEAGDVVVFFYAPSRGNDPGVYGWAVIERCHSEYKILYFIPSPPTNHLKMDPWWDEDVKKVAAKIRGGSPQGTLFPVDKSHIPTIRNGIRKWFSSHKSSD
jgi:hypothetical protein